LHSTKWSDGKKRKDGNYSPQKTKQNKDKNNSIQESVGNEENGHPVSDFNKTMINVAKDPETPT
jgi:hypothetical protein